MRQQRAFGHRPQAGGHVVVGLGHPVVHVAFGLRLHYFQNFGFAFQAVRLELRNRAQCITQHKAVRGQNMADVALLAGCGQHIERIEVGRHVAIGRVHHGGAAIQDVVAAEQQAVLFQHQAQMVGSMAGGVDDAQGVAGICCGRVSTQGQAFAIGQLPLGGEL